MLSSQPAPRVSVVVPCYNHARFLPERFASILAQTWQDFELIVLDDASTDDSVAVIQALLADQPHRLIINQTNSGSPCSQWIRGIKEARGRYIWIAESDDSCSPEFLATLVQRLEQGACLAYCRSSAINVDGIDISASTLYWPDQFDALRWHQPFQQSSQSFCLQWLSRANCIPNASAVIFERKLAMQVCMHLQQILRKVLYTGDWLFWFQYLAHIDAPIDYLAEPLSRFRSHGATTRASSGSAQQELRHLRDYGLACRWLQQQPLLAHSSLLRQRAEDGHWDWILGEYLDRCRPRLLSLLLAQGLEPPLKGLLFVRLLRNPRLQHLAFPRFARWLHVKVASLQTAKARLLAQLRRIAS
jgi:glycosyltransferase involved in cell wall biosynthesis